MKEEVLVFVFDGYADWEPAFVCAELNASDTGHAVKTIAANGDPKTSMGGFRVLPDYTLGNRPNDFALLILPGGEAWLGHGNDAVLPLVEHAIGRRIPVGAICNAASFLAQHGYLDGIAHTGNTLSFMKQVAPAYRGEAHFQERQAVCDAGIVTANGSAALEFGREILALLEAKSQDDIAAWYHMNKQGFYPAD